MQSRVDRDCRQENGSPQLAASSFTDPCRHPPHRHRFSLDQLGTALSRLSLDQHGYVTAEDYERLTGEELDEFSTAGRGLIADLAAQYKCKIDCPPIERRVYFFKSK
jgi:hypothetical protein